MKNCTLDWFDCFVDRASVSKKFSWNWACDHYPYMIGKRNKAWIRVTIFQTRGDARCIVSYTLPQCWRSFSFTRHHRPAINSPGAQRETKPKKARAVLYVSHHAITLTNQSRLHPFSTLFSKRRGRKLSFLSFFLSFSFCLYFIAIPFWLSSSLFGPLFFEWRWLALLTTFLELFNKIIIVCLEN